MKEYELCKWAVAFNIDGKDRISVTAFFRTRENAYDFIDKCLPEETRGRFFTIYADEL